MANYNLYLSKRSPAMKAKITIINILSIFILLAPFSSVPGYSCVSCCCNYDCAQIWYAACVEGYWYAQYLLAWCGEQFCGQAIDCNTCFYDCHFCQNIIHDLPAIDLSPTLHPGTIAPNKAASVTINALLGVKIGRYCCHLQCSASCPC